LKIKITILLVLTVLFSASFIQQRGPLLTYLQLHIPKGWPKPVGNIFANNPLSEQGFQLGRRLFYDGRLSKDGSISCGTCHQQFAAFVSYDHDFSHGFNNTYTTRNAPAIFNVAWMPNLHWDGGINHLEMQPLAPITAPNEMAETLENVLRKISAEAAYKSLFKAAFGDTATSSQRMLKAIAQFVGSIQSYNTRYDKMKRGETLFNISEQYGYNVFKAKCNACHTEPLFTNNTFANNGLSVNPALNDFGRMKVTGNIDDSLKFKVPSLRNVQLTIPYMHDGRLYTLSQVIAHYTSKIDTTQPTLHPLLQHRIAINNQEKVDLLSFLYTLTDEELTHNKRYGPPEETAGTPFLHSH
jgi:cytochrome c peroxidase